MPASSWYARLNDPINYLLVDAEPHHGAEALGANIADHGLLAFRLQIRALSRESSAGRPEGWTASALALGGPRRRRHVSPPECRASTSRTTCTGSVTARFDEVQAAMRAPVRAGPASRRSASGGTGDAWSAPRTGTRFADHKVLRRPPCRVAPRPPGV